MQFTPQQLAGYKGYSTGVLIGNWSEDASLRQEKLVFALQRAGKDRWAESVPVSPAVRAGVAYGSLAGVHLTADGSAVALRKTGRGWELTLAATGGQRRSVWTPRKHRCASAVVEAGQPFYLVNELGEENLYLTASRGTTESIDIVGAAVPSSDSLWQIEADASEAGAFRLRHVMTKSLLTASKKFIEGEPTLTLEKKGGGVFRWKLGAAGASFEDPRESKFAAFQAKVLARCQNEGLRGLQRHFRLMDRDRSGHVSRDELASQLSRLRVPFTSDELTAVFNEIDRNGDGTVSLEELFRSLRDEMNARRRQLVVNAFGSLDDKRQGFVTLEQLVEKFRNSQASKKVKELDKRVADFAASWDKNRDSRIDLAEFIDYYEDISCTIESDDYFELMIRNAWHMSGGEGWSANTTCRRVLVHHLDGSQTVEEVKNDLGVGDNVELIKQRLIDQGITDLERIELYASS